MRLIRDGGKGVWRRERLYTHRYTVTIRMSALRWAAMRATFMFDLLWGTMSQTSTFLKRKESRSGIEPFCLQA